MSTTAPSLVETAFNTFRQKVHTINFDVVLPEEEGDEFEFEALEIPPGQFTYDGVVSLLVRYKYPDDKMAAVVNNYLADPEDDGILVEFEEMQAWRKTAKALAKKVIEEAE